MTNATKDNLERWLTLIGQDQLDALTPEQVARLEQYLNESAAAARQVASHKPALDSFARPRIAPTSDQWNALWANIESTAATDAAGASSPGALNPATRPSVALLPLPEGEGQRAVLLPLPEGEGRGEGSRRRDGSHAEHRSHARRLPPARLFTLWRGVAAAAACIALIVAWRVFEIAGRSPMPIQPAVNAQIDNLEVFGDRTAIVMSAGDDDPFPVIWVMDNEGA